ncbi:MAG TPA: choice-of-anchor tandem repeat GloVer-containing protein [Bryobacteraceae bacterium]|nr:choice-of-anchor tandem repeat GloVer-containing protein [Bryobacteraceae bacterium]
MRTRQRLASISFICIAAASAYAQTAAEKVLHTFGNFPKGTNPYSTLTRDASGNLYGTTYQGGAANLGVVYKLGAAGYQRLYNFQGGADGAEPYAGVTLDTAGNLYGTTYYGGTSSAGVVYKIDTSGQETVLYTFTGGADGGNPYAGVILDSAGNMYGTTYNGGAFASGAVYKVSPSGQETVLYSFTGATDGSNPYAGVIMDPEGNLYGTTKYGGHQPGIWGYGVVYTLSPAGQETVLYTFPGGETGGADPYGGVIRDSAGNLYGATFSGMIYELSPSGEMTVLYQSFTSNIESGLVRDAKGNLYGTASSGPANGGKGSVFKLDTAGNFQVLYAFTGSSWDNASVGPNAGVTLDSAGNLYGATAYGGVGGMVYKISASGQETTLFNFTGAPGGSFPFGSVVRDPEGNLYGTAGGGTTAYGTLYKVDPAGQETVLYTFTGTVGWQIARDSAGNLYGDAGVVIGGGGQIFKFSPSGEYSVLYKFTGGADGTGCNGVDLDAQGNLYGASVGPAAPYGLIFKLTPAGQFSILHTFTGLDGDTPNSALTIDAAGNIYGTTTNGGPNGAGVLFKISAAGQFQDLYAFHLGVGGGLPTAGVVLDAEGNIYGTTQAYGKGWAGTVYKLAPSGNYKVLYSFTDEADGGFPNAVVLDAAGNLYGTTWSGGPAGANGYGVVFELTPSGQETVLHSFTGGDDGSQPEAGVILDPAGNLYGTTPYGGAAQGGVLFKIEMP